MTIGEWGPALSKGTYCLATKYRDGDPADPWAVGYYIEQSADGRHIVGDANGKSFYGNGYRRVRGWLRPEVGDWLVKNCNILEHSPPHTVRLWKMISGKCFHRNRRPTKSIGEK